MLSRLVGILLSLMLCAACSSSGSDACPGPAATVDGGMVASVPALEAIQTVFIITMENKNWDEIQHNPSAPYINGTLLPKASFALNYRNPKGIHPSLPNYLWLEAGNNLCVDNDDDPSSNHQSTTDHLVTYLEHAGVSWKSYQEDITGTECPLTQTGGYVPRHNPMVYFDDVTDNLNPMSQHCIQHVRPYSELATDLQAGMVARYNFITPNLCHDMHDDCGGSGSSFSNEIAQGDTWLSQELPKILSSTSYQQGGAVFIAWDEAEDTGTCPNADCPIGMIVLSPHAKGHGYTNQIAYDHSSTLRTMQEILHAGPYLRGAGTAQDLSDLFEAAP